MTSVLAVIPARGGSKGVLRKNIRQVANKPLIAWTIQPALACPLGQQGCIEHRGYADRLCGKAMGR